jgi:hypothetical protein
MKVIHQLLFPTYTVIFQEGWEATPGFSFRPSNDKTDGMGLGSGPRRI